MSGLVLMVLTNGCLIITILQHKKNKMKFTKEDFNNILYFLENAQITVMGQTAEILVHLKDKIKKQLTEMGMIVLEDVKKKKKKDGKPDADKKLPS